MDSENLFSVQLDVYPSLARLQGIVVAETTSVPVNALPANPVLWIVVAYASNLKSSI